MHARCVHTAENAFSSPLESLTKIPAWLPKRKICPLFGFTSWGLSANVTVCAVDSSTSGGRHGLVLGIVGGYGRVLVGTAGWRARFCTILALFAGPTVTNHTRLLGATAAAYGVPLYRRLDALVGEWGPDGDLVAQLTSA